MNCPNCHAPIDPAAIPDDTLRSERARRNQAKRVTLTPGTGRKPVPTLCRRCGQLQPSASAARRHKCEPSSAASAIHGLTSQQAAQHSRLMAMPSRDWPQSLLDYMANHGPHFNGEHIAADVAAWIKENSCAR